MIDSSSETALKTTTINSHQSGKEKKESKTFFALSSQENCAKYSAHSNLTRMILGNVSVEDAVEVMYVLHLQVFMSRLIFYFDIS